MANAIMLGNIGGGGTGLELVKTYTLTESWENDEKGNPIAVYNTIFADVAKSLGDMFVCIVKNNTATAWANCNALVYYIHDEGTIAGSGFFVRNNWTAGRHIGSEMSSWISSGASIDIYKSYNLIEL